MSDKSLNLDLEQKIKSLESTIASQARHITAVEEEKHHLRILLDESFQFIGLLSPDGTLLEVNQSALRFAGIAKEAVVGKPFWEAPWWSHSKPLQLQLKSAIETACHDEFIRFKVSLPSTDGNTHHIDFSISPVKDPSGKVMFLIPEGRNIHEIIEKKNQLKAAYNQLEEEFKQHSLELARKNDELQKQINNSLIIKRELDKSQEHYQLISQSTNESIWATDLDLNLTFINPKGLQMLGFEDETEFLGHSTASTFLTDSHNRFNHVTHQLQEKMKSGKTAIEIFEASFQHKKGHIVETEVTVFPTVIDGMVVGYHGRTRDITDQKTIERELQKLSQAIEKSINMVFITDSEGQIEYVNTMFEEITGYSRSEAIGQNPRILASGETPKAVYKELWDTIKSGQSWRGDFKNKKKNGTFYWGKGLITPIQNHKNEVTHFLAIQEDTTNRILAEEKANYLKDFDIITGLLNRDRFIKTLDQDILLNRTGVMMLIDIDEIKMINNTYGHNRGDDFLKRLITRIMEAISTETNTNQPEMGRLGEDEIAVNLPDFSGDQGFQTAEMVRKAVETFRFTDENIHTTLSIGVVRYPDHGQSSQELLSNANTAIIRAKELGNNRCHLYHLGDQHLAKIQSRLRQKKRIISALKDDRFEAWFQPILNIQKNKIHHFEVLARMTGEKGRIILPGAFIGAAETFGLIGSIGRKIMARTIAFQAEMRRAGHPVSFAMNLSGKDLGDDRLLQFLQDRIQETGANPNNLVFEITETAAIQDLDHAISFINKLKSIGCRFSLDDFGVGFTSFVYLREMQVDFIKIDGIFIRKLQENKSDQDIVKSIATVAQGLGIKTIAEYVEKEETLDLIKEIGIDYAQGFLIGKPAPTITNYLNDL